MEKSRGFYKSSKYIKFAKNVNKVKKNLLLKLWSLKLKNKKIVGIGCPGRSITLLAFCGINNEILDYIAEQSSSLKLNLFTPSTHIKILDEKNLIKNQPDYALILSWHYGKNIIKNLRKKGYKGKFIIPLPYPKIVN
jgi:ABC-type antimicrobial peptide transport system ATPase subunit